MLDSREQAKIVGLFCSAASRLFRPSDTTISTFLSSRPFIATSPLPLLKGGLLHTKVYLFMGHIMSFPSPRPPRITTQKLKCHHLVKSSGHQCSLSCCSSIRSYCTKIQSIVVTLVYRSCGVCEENSGRYAFCLSIFVFLGGEGAFCFLFCSSSCCCFSFECLFVVVRCPM